jgi:hypothetical protein
MNRRDLIGGLLTSSALSPAFAKSDIKVIYIGGWDCPPCLHWKSREKPAWVASPEYKQVTYIEIDAHHLKRAYDNEYWPVELRPIRDQLPQKFGTPRFLVVRDGTVIANRFRGSDYWTGTLADIRKALAS